MTIKTDFPGPCLIPLDSFHQKPSRSTWRKIEKIHIRAILYYLGLYIYTYWEVSTEGSQEPVEY
ncbi:hypothetical protein [Methanosarcina barkeri]|uniref:hypothetical protein n=1 Tax=Methanosarcina barkeri TaxID=2208 RepID=UPI00003C6695|nr:hypothetical protein [Methanosarcina barkeri]